MIGLEDINELRNGLLLSKPLEWAFDNSKLSIIPDTTFVPPTYMAVVVDADIMDTRLLDKLMELKVRTRCVYAHNVLPPLLPLTGIDFHA